MDCLVLCAVKIVPDSCFLFGTGVREQFDSLLARLFLQLHEFFMAISVRVLEMVNKVDDVFIFHEDWNLTIKTNGSVVILFLVEELPNELLIEDVFFLLQLRML